MSVTVSDVLQLDILNSAKVIAGKNGLDREVLADQLYRLSDQSPCGCRLDFKWRCFYL